MFMEIWKDIPGYEARYAGSNFGRVKSYARYVWNGRGIKPVKERFLALNKLNKEGHRGVTLCKDGTKKIYHVHRLVAQLFIPNPENLPNVLHRDDDPTNNRVDNLYWGTQKDNMDDCHTKGRHTKPKRPVIGITTDGAAECFESVIEAERQTGVANAHISACCRGKRKTAGGLIWRYVY